MSWQDRPYNRYEEEARSSSGFSSMSVVKWLIVINAVVFLWDGVFIGSARGGAIAIAPHAYFSVEKAIHYLQLWRWVTYQFVHVNLMHVFFNMLVLFFFGPMMERWWGSQRFLAFYLLCGISGAFVTTLFGAIPGLIFFTPHTELYGASGSIFGILVACAMLYPHQRVMLIFPPIPMSMRTLAMGLLAMSVLSVMAGSENAGGEAAHLGGALLGFYLVKHPSLLNLAERITRPARRGKGRWRSKQQPPQREGVAVDRILTKVKNRGLHSLTRGEKKTLQRATDRHRHAS